MKKIYIHMMMLAAMVVAGAAMTSCQKEEAVTGKLSMTVKATKGGGNAKALSLDPNNEHTLNATWAEDEQVTVHNDTKNADLEGYLEAQSDGSETTLYGTLTGTIASNDWLTLKFCSDNYNNQDGTLEYIAANCDYATATVQVTVDGDGKVHTGNATFTNHQAIIKFTLLNKADDAAINATQLVISNGSNTYTVNPSSATSEIFVAIPGFSNKTTHLTATVGNGTYIYEKENVTFSNGQYYEITVKMTPVDFSVSASTKVLFAPGNLQATTSNLGSNWTWSFASNQWDFIGNNTANTSINGNRTVSANGTVDLFGWVGVNSTKYDYYGIANSNYYGYYSGETLKNDWGEAANGLGGHTDWRTPTKDEWYYLFETRTNASQKYGHGIVNNVHGLIILPDNWTLPTGLTFTSGSTSWSNSYTIAEWRKMEKNGAVFLPAAGVRSTNTVSYYDGDPDKYPYGYYWSSTNYNTNYAYFMRFGQNSLTSDSHDGSNHYKSFGHSVRLVRTVN